MNDDYIYEMGKLYDKYGDEKYFNWLIYPVLKEKWKDNKRLCAELENMKDNLNNKAEYYRSYGRIQEILMINDLQLQRNSKRKKQEKTNDGCRNDRYEISPKIITTCI